MHQLRFPSSQNGIIYYNFLASLEWNGRILTVFFVTAAWCLQGAVAYPLMHVQTPSCMSIRNVSSPFCVLSFFKYTCWCICSVKVIVSSDLYRCLYFTAILGLYLLCAISNNQLQKYCSVVFVKNKNIWIKLYALKRFLS